MAISLYPGQLQALRNLECGKILAGDVGSGKSIVGLAFYYTKIAGGSIKINGEGDNTFRAKKVPLYIITTAKKRDSLEWWNELSRFALGVDDEITIDSWNNIKRYEHVKDSFFIFDEQRLVGSGGWVKAFYRIARANGWILLSATPGDVWMDYVPVFVANRFYRNKTEFAREHVVYTMYGGFPKVDRYVNTIVLEKLRSRILVEIPFTRHTTRHIMPVMCDHDPELFKRVWKDRWNYKEERPIQDISELFRLSREVVNTHPSRTKHLRELLEKHPRLIVFYNFNYELQVIRDFTTTLPSTVETAEWNGSLHQQVPSGDSWLYLVQYTAGAEGWECTTTDAIVFFSLNYSYKIWAQAMGRIDRLNTPFQDLYYYVMQSRTPIDKAIYRSNRRKQMFNERGFARKLDT